MLLIGLTGGSGVGKGEVGKAFANSGFAHIDTDLDAKTVVKKGGKCLKEITQNFENVILENGELNRKALGKIVFQNPEQLEKLNSIIHKYISKRIEKKLKELKKNGVNKVVIDGAALIESGIYKQCFKVIAVISNEENKIERIMKRDNLSLEEAKMRIYGQKSDDFFTKNADFVIINDNGIGNLNKKVNDIIILIEKDYIKWRKKK